MNVKEENTDKSNTPYPSRLLLIVITIYQNKHNPPIKKRTINNSKKY